MAMQAESLVFIQISHILIINKENYVKKVKITMLSSMADTDFERALDTHVQWNIELVDLKDAIFGKSIVELTREEAGHAAALIQDRALSVYCLSTGLFHGDIEAGEGAFRRDYQGKVEHIISLANVFNPKLIRLLAAQTPKRAEIENCAKYINKKHSWLIPAYAEAVDMIFEAGYKTTIENETGNCIFSNPDEVIEFFRELNRPDKVSLTWDVQNLWQMGTYPTIEVYLKLRNTIGYYHLKGGQSKSKGGELIWRSALEDASWPVVEITKQVIHDGAADVLCLNSSHGQVKEKYDFGDMAKRDLDFIRAAIPEIQ